ncbi:hypothetical protein HDU97_006323 [Phlyctochytrium planicorne]|nr:hypothetical protein HDU97_006323 [Phlyctochytrium planicorne]
MAQSVPESDIPCSPSIPADNLTPYVFFVKNAASFPVDIYYRELCEYKLGLAGFNTSAKFFVKNVALGQVYLVRPAGDTKTVLAALVYSPELNLTQEKPWTIGSDTIGKIIMAPKPDGGSGGTNTTPFIIGGVVGFVVICAAVGGILFIMYRRKHSFGSSPTYSYNKKGELNVGGQSSSSMPDAQLGSASLKQNGTLNYPNHTNASFNRNGTMGSNAGTKNRNSLMWWQNDQNQMQNQLQNQKNGTIGRSTNNNSPYAAPASATLPMPPQPTSPVTNGNDFNPEPGTRLRVIHPHRRDLEDELCLYPGDAVVMLESYGDGWCLARVVRSRRQHQGNGISAVGDEGMIPVGCLDSVADRSLGRGGKGTIGRDNGNNATSPSLSRYEDDTYWTGGKDSIPREYGNAPKSGKRVKSLQRPESMALFQAAGRDISQYY